MPTNPPGYFRDYYRAKRRAAIDKLGGRCTVCGFDDPRALEFDHFVARQHVRCPGGKKYRYGVLKAILDGTDTSIQLLCSNCHSIKSWENGDYLQGVRQGD